MTMCAGVWMYGTVWVWVLYKMSGCAPDMRSLRHLREYTEIISTTHMSWYLVGYVLCGCLAGLAVSAEGLQGRRARVDLI
jgi:hypothetical protein